MPAKESLVPIDAPWNVGTGRPYSFIVDWKVSALKALLLYVNGSQLE